MKQILVGVLAFVLALGGASAFNIMKAKGAAEVAAAERSAEGTGPSASTGEEPAGGAGRERPAEPDFASMGADSTETGFGGEGSPPDGGAGTQFAAVDLAGDAASPASDGPAAAAPDLGDGGPVSDLNPEGIRRMARIFGAMKPQEAAAVLQRMSDEEVRGVMLQMGDRPAAAILSVFDPERAAALSRVVLGRRGAP
jgi:hypothetical protein